MPLLKQVLEKYPKEVKIAFKHFPLKSHPFATKAAVAALAAGRQGKFWEFHDQLYKDYDKINGAKIEEISRNLGLDQGKFEKDRKDNRLRERISQDISEGVEAGVRGTPTIFINGRRLRNRSLEGFQAAIERELKKARRGQ